MNKVSPGDKKNRILSVLLLSALLSIVVYLVSITLTNKMLANIEQNDNNIIAEVGTDKDSKIDQRMNYESREIESTTSIEKEEYDVDASIIARDFFEKMLSGSDEIDFKDSASDGEIILYKEGNNYYIAGRAFSILSDMQCFLVEDSIYYFKGADSLIYKIVDNQNGFTVYYGDDKDGCIEECGRVDKSLQHSDSNYGPIMEPYMIAGLYEKEDEPSIKISLSMYTDYVEMGDEVGNLSFEGNSYKYLVYWTGNNEYNIVSGNYVVHATIQKSDNELIMMLDGDDEFAGTFVRIQEYIS